MTRAQSTAVVLAVLIAAGPGGCGGNDDTTTVIDETTTTTVTSGETTTEDATTTAEADDDGGDDEPDGDDGSGAALSLRSFKSPSGNIGCLMTRRSVRCDIAEKSWSAPRPAGCPPQSDFGQGLILPASGPGAVVCAGDTVLGDPEATVLDYGSSSQVGPITCESDESGVECENARGDGFSLSREEYELD